MDIDRRKLLAGSTCLALTGLVESAVAYCRSDTAERDEAPPWHLLTRSLLDCARRANTASTERLIRDVARAQGYAKPPVIKWLADPFDAFAYLSRLGLDELLQMNNAQLWRRAGPKTDLDEDRLNSHLVLGGMIGDTVRASDMTVF